MHLWRWGAIGQSYNFYCNILRPPNCLEDLRSPDINNTKWLEDLVDFVWTAAHTHEEEEIGIRLWVETAKSSNWSKLTKHHTTVRSGPAVRKICEKRKVMRERSALMSEETHKKVSASVRRFTELDGKVFFGLINMHQANFPSTFTNHSESKRNCWTIISNREF